MYNYIHVIVTDFKPYDPSNKNARTPAANHPFKVRDDQKKLLESLAQLFHTFTAPALFSTKRSGPDIHTAVAFITTRVLCPDDDDWINLVRLIRYLRATLTLPLILSADSTNIVKWWVHGSFGVHPGTRSQTPPHMERDPSFQRQFKKLNTSISTETELVAADYLMPHLCWTNYFLKNQGYDINSTVMYQDNQSAILLENNGRSSSSRRTKHLNIRYFFITDRIKKGELRIEYCPTDDMVADFFTKPLQGKKFIQFRKIIMNLKE